MSLELIYWILMLVWLVFGIVGAWPVNGGSIRTAVPNILLFILLLILGWAQFGAPVET
jgi:hypothetical protein